MNAPMLQPMPAVSYLPETAPFSEEQRAWLNGFFAAVLSPPTGTPVALDRMPPRRPPRMTARPGTIPPCPWTSA